MQPGETEIAAQPSPQRNAKNASLRILLGFLVAPIIPGVMVEALTLIRLRTFGWIGMGVELAAFFGYPVALILGVPLYLLFRRLGWVAFSTYVVAGAVLGVVPFAFFFVPPALECVSGAGSESHACLVLTTMAPFGIYSTAAGIAATIAFWLIARPDKSHRTLKTTA